MFLSSTCMFTINPLELNLKASEVIVKKDTKTGSTSHYNFFLSEMF